MFCFFFFSKINSSNVQVLINLNLLTNTCANESKRIQFFPPKKSWDIFLLLNASSPSRNWNFWSNVHFSCSFTKYANIWIFRWFLSNVRAPKGSQHHTQLFSVNEYFSNKWSKMCKKQQIYLTRGSKEFLRMFLKPQKFWSIYFKNDLYL